MYSNWSMLASSLALLLTVRTRYITKKTLTLPIKNSHLALHLQMKGGVSIVNIDDVKINKKDPTPALSRTRGWVDFDLKKGHPSLQSHARGWACCYLLLTVRSLEQDISLEKH
jgi:hypothetical protein